MILENSFIGGGGGGGGGEFGNYIYTTFIFSVAREKEVVNS